MSAIFFCSCRLSGPFSWLRVTECEEKIFVDLKSSKVDVKTATANSFSLGKDCK